MKEEFWVNQERCVVKTIEESDVRAFAEVSGDKNPIHIDEEYAKKSMFGKRIVHGMLSAAYISAVIGNEFPGTGTIYMEQSMRFLKPVYIGDEVKVLVRIKELQQKGRALLQTNVMNMNGELVIEGEALVKLPQKQEGETD